MKKLLGIVVLGLLWCNVGFAEEMLIPSEEVLNSACKELKKTKLECDDFKRMIKNLPKDLENQEKLKKKILEQYIKQPTVPDWILIWEGNKDFPNKYYVDKNSVKKEEKYKYFRTLSNHEPRTSGSISTTIIYKVDCNKLKAQTLHVTDYSLTFGAGDIISDFDTSEEKRSKWNTGVPNSPFKKALKTVCTEM